MTRTAVVKESKGRWLLRLPSMEIWGWDFAVGTVGDGTAFSGPSYASEYVTGISVEEGDRCSALLRSYFVTTVALLQLSEIMQI